MINKNSLSHIVIAGNGIGIWAMAAALAEQLPEHTHITIIEDSSAPNTHEFPPAITIDCDSPFHQLLGWSDAQLIMEAGGQLSLGTNFVGWQGEASHYMSAPSGKLPGINGVAFHHIVLRAAMARGEPEKLPEIFAAFRFPARVAMAGKLAHGSSDPQSPRTLLRPSITLDTSQYMTMLQHQARASSSISHHQTKIDRLVKDENAPTIKSVILEDGQEFAADLFIDLTGLLSAPSPSETDDFPLPFDRIISSQYASDEESGPTVPVMRAFDQAIMMEASLAHSNCKTIIYPSAHLSDDHARGLLDSQPISAEPGHLRSFCNPSPWIANLVRAGQAAGQMGPYLSADMRLLHQQIINLCNLLPASRHMDVEANEYNRLNIMQFNQLRDFYLLPFVRNGRSEKFWENLRRTALPESLQIRLDQFLSRGRLVTFDDEIFEEQHWIDLMIGFGVIPQRFDPMAQTIDLAQVGPSLGKMVDAFKQTIDAMPVHQIYMDQLAAAASRQMQTGNQKL
ncbi:MAG: tryptophan 7-halogenase [Parasphingorhabdus sp.]|uniref:tryptophan 7-halogenase n=1 Tax=Parasphingorhabdus sp. TaxID=2709688 RepID=UPI00329719FA